MHNLDVGQNLFIGIWPLNQGQIPIEKGFGLRVTQLVEPVEGRVADLPLGDITHLFVTTISERAFSKQAAQVGRFGPRQNGPFKRKPTDGEVRESPDAFLQLQVELSYAKASIQAAVRELDIDPGRISKWRQRHKKNDRTMPANTTLTDEKQQIRRLQRELREAQMERDILKTGAPVRGRSASSPRATAPADRGDIPIYKGKHQPIPHGPPLRLRRCVKC